MLDRDATLAFPELATDGTYVYWSHQYVGWIKRIPATGGSAITIHPGSGTADIIAMRVHSEHVYWAEGEPGTLLSSLWRARLDGSDPIVINPGQSVTAIAVDAENLYWTGAKEVQRAPVEGGAPTLLVNRDGIFPSLALDATHVYFSTFYADRIGEIMQVPKAGGTAVALAQVQGLNALSVDGDSVYWSAATEDGAGGIYKLAKTGGEPVTLAAGLSRPVSLALDDAAVYWTELGLETDPIGRKGSVKRVPISGGRVTTVASGLADPWRIVSVGARLVWGEEFFDHKLMSLLKDPCRSGACVE